MPESPHRFVVLTWLHDHWGVSVSCEDEALAQRAMANNHGHLSLLINTQALLINAQDPRHGSS